MPENFYVQLILPLKLQWEPWYSSETELYPGKRVNVIFSHRRYTAVVHRCSGVPDVPANRVSPIIGVAEGMPDISARELELWEFISSYYLCTIGEVYKAAYPLGKIRSEEVAPRAMERLRERIARLEAEIDRRGGSSRCNANVTARLTAEKNGLLAQLEALCGEGSRRGTQKAAHTPGKPVLLNGKDRTQYYLDAIGKADSDVLILVPDFVSGDILYSRLKESLPEIIRTDSRNTAPQRRKAAELVRSSVSKTIILGTRADIFLPFSKLSLVIVDEEQDSSYKQEDPAPRYNGRDCAVKLAQIHGAQVILGTSLPSLDSLYNCLSGRYTQVDLPGEGSPAQAQIVDIAAEKRKNGMAGVLSRKVLDAAAGYPGKVVLVRGWEKDDEIARAAELLGRPDIGVIRWRQLAETPLEDCLVVVLQADALVSKEDFRADEKALHILDKLRSRCGSFILQTSVPERFNSSRSLRDLLKERRQFGFPPYTRLVQTRKKDGKETTGMHFLKKDAGLAAAKKALLGTISAEDIIDVDPL